MLKCAEEMPNRAACAPQKIPLLLPRRSFNRLNRTHLWSVSGNVSTCDLHKAIFLHERNRHVFPTAPTVEIRRPRSRSIVVRLPPSGYAARGETGRRAAAGLCDQPYRHHSGYLAGAGMARRRDAARVRYSGAVETGAASCLAPRAIRRRATVVEAGFLAHLTSCGASRART